MAASAQVGPSSELLIQTPDKDRLMPLVLPRYRLGRSTVNELAFPEDMRLSREHLVFEKAGDAWQVRDLGSSNGTRVNGDRIDAPTTLRHGDQVAAGGVEITFRGAQSETDPGPVVAFFDELGGADPTLSINLATAMKPAVASNRADATRITALLQAGRELARHRPLSELFDVILDLSAEAVGASRGVLLVLEDGVLEPRSSKGEYFSLSTTVRDRVMAGESLLVADTHTHLELAGIRSLANAHVRSILAVPLQSDRGVLGLIYVDSPDRVAQFTSDDLSLLTVMANIAGIRIEHARLLEVEQAERRMAQELDQAALIQQGLLPATPPVCPDLELAGFNVPCRKVGGDYYDFWRYEDGRVAVIIADVAGKGMPAALLMANLQASAHVLFDAPGSLAEQVSRLNRAVATNTPSSSFITFFTALVNPSAGTLTYCNAGHNPPMLLRSQGECEYLGPTGMVLGIIPNAPYTHRQCAFEPGDALLMFSDGVTESFQAGTNEEFGEERLEQAFRSHADETASGIVESVRAELMSFSAGAPASDDVTLVVLRR